MNLGHKLLKLKENDTLYSISDNNRKKKTTEESDISN